MITVVGLGFVGLTTALGLSSKGFKVYGYEIDEKKRQSLLNESVPFHEPGVPEQLKKDLGKNFVIADSLDEAISNSQVVFYCVGTPSDETGKANLDYLLGAIDSTLTAIDKNDDPKVLVVKSTVPPSTTQERVLPFLQEKGWDVGTEIGLANNPEFLREGFAWDDFINPDRVVLGVSDDRSFALLKKLYEPFECPVHQVSLNTGEFIKYLSNALLSTMISYSNEMSMIGRAIGDVDIAKAFKILHEDKRWYGEPAKMKSYVYPGCGFGGYCLPKDTEALVAQSQSAGYDAGLLREVLRVNREIREHIVEQVEKTVSKDQTVGILGLSFKPGSDDVRESPAKDLIERLLAKGYTKLVGYDPLANDLFKDAYGFSMDYAPSFEDCVEQADTFLILTGWDEFKDKKDKLSGKTVLDYRYIL